MTPPTPQDILRAYANIAENPLGGIFPGYTKMLTDPRLEKRSGGVKMALALENMQPTFSYKMRGALEELMHISPEALKRGVVTASSGNHGQAVAWLASKLGIPCIVVVPAKAPEVKTGAIEFYGGKVIRYGELYDTSYAYAQQLAETIKATYIDLSTRAAVAGAAAWVLEALEQVPHVDAVITPVGGGTLLSGTAIAVKDYLLLSHFKRLRKVIILLLLLFISQKSKRLAKARASAHVEDFQQFMLRSLII